MEYLWSNFSANACTNFLFSYNNIKFSVLLKVFCFITHKILAYSIRFVCLHRFCCISSKILFHELYIVRVLFVYGGYLMTCLGV